MRFALTTFWSGPRPLPRRRFRPAPRPPAKAPKRESRPLPKAA